MNTRHGGEKSSPVVIARPQHNVSRSDISEPALKVLYRLKKGGYAAFLVGGAVRDLLIGGHPKDFDIGTDASPEDVRALFRNCRLIGRRFRLAHVHFGREVIEVATFRSSDNSDDDADRRTDEEGRLLRDNVYGSIDEDVWRRDFTANALYYNIADFSIWDFVGGLADVEARVLRMIGDPDQRYREDPVRMLRAVRFAAKLNFSIHPDTEAPLYELGELLANVPPARLFDELIKLLLGGSAEATFDLLRRYNLAGRLLPAADVSLDLPQADADRELVRLALAGTDQRVADGRPVTIMFLLAAMLWPSVRDRAGELQGEDYSRSQALFVACDQVLESQRAFITIPRRIQYPIRDMLVMQDRLTQRQGKRPQRLLQHQRFRAAYDLLLLRAAVGEEDQELADWWTEFQLNPGAQIASTDPGPSRKRRPRRRRRGRKPGGGEGGNA